MRACGCDHVNKSICLFAGNTQNLPILFASEVNCSIPSLVEWISTDATCRQHVFIVMAEMLHCCPYVCLTYSQKKKKKRSCSDWFKHERSLSSCCWAGRIKGPKHDIGNLVCLRTCNCFKTVWKVWKPNKNREKTPFEYTFLYSYCYCPFLQNKTCQLHHTFSEVWTAVIWVHNFQQVDMHLFCHYIACEF